MGTQQFIAGGGADGGREYINIMAFDCCTIDLLVPAMHGEHARLSTVLSDHLHQVCRVLCDDLNSRINSDSGVICGFSVSVAGAGRAPISSGEFSHPCAALGVEVVEVVGAYGSHVVDVVVSLFGLIFMVFFGDFWCCDFVEWRTMFLNNVSYSFM